MPVRDVVMKQVFCCNKGCDVPGPMAVTESGVMWDAQMVGWECIFGVTICPRCSELGRLPSDVEDIRVTTVPEPVTVVEGQ